MLCIISILVFVALAILIISTGRDGIGKPPATWNITCYSGGIELLNVTATEYWFSDKGHVFEVDGHEYRVNAACVSREN